MKKLIGGALIALSMVVGVSANEGYDIRDSDFGFFSYIPGAEISSRYFEYVYSNDSCLKADSKLVKKNTANQTVKFYDNGMIVLFGSDKVFFQSKDSCLAYLDQKKEFKNIFLSAMNYKLRLSKGKTCEKVEEKEKPILLNKMLRKFGKDNIIIQKNNPNSVLVTLKKGNKQMDYYFFSTKKGCRDFQKYLNNFMIEHGQDPVF